MIWQSSKECGQIGQWKLFNRLTSASAFTDFPSKPQNAILWPVSESLLFAEAIMWTCKPYSQSCKLNGVHRFMSIQ